MVRGLALFIPIFQILAAVHAFRSGRESYWLWIILFFPGAGTLIYFLMEILPDIRRGSLRDLWEETLESWIPGRQLKRLREQLEMTDTVANRQALAEFLLELGRGSEAVALFQECLAGHWKDDPEILLGLARAHLAAGSPDLALSPLEFLEKENPAYQTAKRELLLARVLEKKGRVEDALRAYERAASQASGAEAFFRQGLFLARVGRKEEAKIILEQVLSQAKSSGKIYRRLERDWIQRSKRVLAELRK